MINQRELLVLGLYLLLVGVGGHLKDLVRVKVGHLVVELRDLIDDHGHEDPADKDEEQGHAAAELFPRVLLLQPIALL